MRARAEWEKIQKERKARNDEHAYGHYAKRMIKNKLKKIIYDYFKF